MNEALALRRRADLSKLKELQARMPRALEITKVSGDPPNSIKLRILIPTAKNSNYPTEKQDYSEVNIMFPENYPLPPGPSVNFTTPIWNPNVYPSGKWCFGEWKITENLELFVGRLMKVIALDPSIINPRSAANSAAAQWFVNMHARLPGAFPTIKLSEMMSDSEKPKIGWRTIK